METIFFSIYVLLEVIIQILSNLQSILAYPQLYASSFATIVVSILIDIVLTYIYFKVIRKNRPHIFKVSEVMIALTVIFLISKFADGIMGILVFIFMLAAGGTYTN